MPGAAEAGPTAIRFAFAGTHHFAELVLDGLADAGLRPVVVVTSPDRPKGRRGTPTPPAIKAQALALGAAVMQPERISDPRAVDELLEFAPQVFVVCAYGQIIRQNVLDALPTVVVHPSLVPRWRGAAPVERSLMAGEVETGVTLLKMTAGVDEGPIGDLRRVQVPGTADGGEAYELLAAAAVTGLVATLPAVVAGEVEWRPQEGEASYAAKLTAADRVIDWGRPAHEIVDLIRALAPHIGAVTELLGKRTLIWRAAAGSGPLPTADEQRLALPAGDGWVEILELQQEGRGRLSAADFLRGAGRALLADS